ncbi:MAG: toprim domain-containing protein [Rhodospirillales bacterium]|nr:toprim domain-containing protein [Rhodospirillales bacterium]
MTGAQGGQPSSAPLAELCRQLDQRIDEIARRLLGEPNWALSTRAQLRFGRNGSLAVEIAGARRGRWYDHEQKQGGSALDLVVRCTGLSQREAAERAAAKLGLAVERRSPPPPRRRIVTAYDYRDETGAVLFQVVRYAPKTFRQRCPDGHGGWSWRVRGIRQVPYRLPELLGAALDVPVFVVEGEKDADRLASLGLVATCNAGGANTWPEALTPAFAGRTVYILPDNDAAGRSHAQKVAAALEAVAANIHIVTLPDLTTGGDVSDWLDDGGDAAELLQLCRAAPAWKRNGADSQPEDPVLLPYCEEAITLAFSERNIDHFRYCDVLGKWFEWDEGRWREDDKRRVFTHARKLCREKSGQALADVEHERAAMRIANTVAAARTVAAVVNLARADGRHATAPADWDADPWVLNTPAGIVDLRCGELGPHSRAALCSKMTAAAPSQSACPRWRRFLDEVTGGDVELQAFLARVAGYGLTGSTREHALFFLYGTGANGKGTFLNMLTGILGDYAQIAGMDTFTESQTDRHPAELAVLRGARVVAAQETDEGRRWAESRIKALTGGDPITARFMRQDFFTYAPQFKLLIAGNHKPGLRNIDEAIRRRFHLLPFTVRIPPEQRDPKLSDKLREEWSAILGWAIEGCLEWQAGGLNPPVAVVDATAEYFDDEDSFGQWLGECCIRDARAHETTRDLYAAWSAWADRAGMLAGSEPKFRGALKARGFVAKREAGTGRSGFVGVGLRRRDYTDDRRYGD